MALPKRVKMVEVGPRDGLQNESKTLPAATKVSLIERLERHEQAGVVGDSPSSRETSNRAHSRIRANRIHRLP